MTEPVPERRVVSIERDGLAVGLLRAAVVLEPSLKEITQRAQHRGRPRRLRVIGADQRVEALARLATRGRHQIGASEADPERSAIGSAREEPGGFDLPSLSQRPRQTKRDDARRLVADGGAIELVRLELGAQRPGADRSSDVVQLLLDEQPAPFAQLLIEDAEQRANLGGLEPLNRVGDPGLLVNRQRQRTPEERPEPGRVPLRLRALHREHAFPGLVHRGDALGAALEGGILAVEVEDLGGPSPGVRLNGDGLQAGGLERFAERTVVRRVGQGAAVFRTPEGVNHLVVQHKACTTFSMYTERVARRAC